MDGYNLQDSALWNLKEDKKNFVAWKNAIGGHSSKLKVEVW